MADYSRVPKEFADIVNSFFGSQGGNIFSPVWVCGLEPVGGYPADEPICIEDEFVPESFESLQMWEQDDFADAADTKSRAVQGVYKLLAGIGSGSYESRRRWERKTASENRLDGPLGHAFLLNKYPVSFPSGGRQWGF